MQELVKYPRTPHIEGSKKQLGDEDLDFVPFEFIANKNLVIEEKIDGANSAISFSSKGELLLQSRGHYLTGGYRERHFNLLKTWANIHRNNLFDILGEKLVMFGEWMYAKHTIFYNNLPNYFMEFDIYDKSISQFLSTKTRRKLLAKHNFISSVFVLFEGQINNLNQLERFIKHSHFISGNHLMELKNKCNEIKLNSDRVLKETDNSSLMEGLYIKYEDDNYVLGRYKYIRGSYLTNVINSESHWLDRPIIPNLLKPGVNLYNLETNDVGI